MKATIAALAALAGLASALPKWPAIASTVVTDYEESGTAVATVYSKQTLVGTRMAVETMYAPQIVSPTTYAVATVYGLPVGSAAVKTYYSAEGQEGMVEPVMFSRTFFAPVERVEVTSTVYVKTIFELGKEVRERSANANVCVQQGWKRDGDDVHIDVDTGHHDGDVGVYAGSDGYGHEQLYYYCCASCYCTCSSIHNRLKVM